MQDTDTGTQGGAIDKTKKPIPLDLSSNANVQVVSSDAGDTTQTVTITGRDAGGVQYAEGKVLTGLTPVALTVNTTTERWLKALKSATCAGDVAVEKAGTAFASGTCQAGSAQRTVSTMAFAKLAAGASATDNAYQFMVVRITGGTGAGQIRWVVEYLGATKEAFVNKDWGTLPDATSTYDLREGFVFEKTPTEVMECRRPFYDAVADVLGGSNRNYYEKLFLSNEHATLALTSAVVSEGADPSGKIDFALENALGGVFTVTNRTTAPTGHGETFDSTAKNVANSQNLTAGNAQSIWVHLALTAGDAAAKSSYTIQVDGQSI